MSNNPFEEQVGRIVGNVLAAGGAICLPEVGSLCVERHRAQRLSRRTVQPPYRAVAFTSQQRGVSLVEEIARVLGTSGMAADVRAGNVVGVEWTWNSRRHICHRGIARFQPWMERNQNSRCFCRVFIPLGGCSGFCREVEVTKG